MYKHLTSPNFVRFANAYPEHLNGKNRHFVMAAFIAKVFGVKVIQVTISSNRFAIKAKNIGASDIPGELIQIMELDGLFQGVSFVPTAEMPAPVLTEISSKELAVLETQAKELVLPNIA